MAEPVVAVPEVTSRSRVVDGPGLLRFDFPATHVVLSWRGSDGMDIRYREIDTRGRFSPWKLAHEAHDLEKGERHYSGVITLDRASGIEWALAGKRQRSPSWAEVFYMNTSDGPAVERALSTQDQAADGTPDIVTRAEWGANESLKSTSGGCKRGFYPVQQLFVHHTVSSNNATDYHALMRAIYEFHTKGRGWCDLGYNFVIAPDGTIFEGRWARRYSNWETHTSEDRLGRAVGGAHVSGFNSGSVGISMMGDFTQAKLTPMARASLVDLLAWEADRHDLSPTATHVYRNPSTGATKTLPVIAGHRDAGNTACPGGNVYKDLPSIRSDVQTAIGTGRESTYLSLVASPSKVTPGQSVTLSGALTGGTGVLSRQTVILYFKTGKVWKELTRFVTELDGSYEYTYTPTSTTRFEASFEGDETSWASASDRRKVVMKPEVTLRAEGGVGESSSNVRYAAPGKVVLTGDTEPAVSGSLNLKVFKVKRDGSERFVRKKSVTLNNGIYQTGFRIKRPGQTFRAVVWFPRSSRFAASRSNSVVFSADA